MFRSTGTWHTSSAANLFRAIIREYEKWMKESMKLLDVRCKFNHQLTSTWIDRNELFAILLQVFFIFFSLFFNFYHCLFCLLKIRHSVSPSTKNHMRNRGRQSYRFYFRKASGKSAQRCERQVLSGLDEWVANLVPCEDPIAPSLCDTRMFFLMI